RCRHRMARRARRSAWRIRHRRADRPSGGAAKPRRHAPLHSIRRLPRHRFLGRSLFRPYTLGMVRFVRAPLTRVGFRRDVRLFLTGLVGFLVALIFILLLLLRANLAHTEEAIDRSHQMIADVSAEAVNRSAQAGLDTALLVLRGR